MDLCQIFLLLFIYFGTLLCNDIKLYLQNSRVTGVKLTKQVRSLLECTVLYRSDGDSLSFNYKPDNKMCELSDRYPEYSTVPEIGSLVYSHIVDGSWSGWLQWGSCSVTCGGGTRTRVRTCTSPSPSNGGLSCPGDDSEHLVCNTQFCPVDGSWSGWLQWGSCSVTCGGGTRTRVRTCTSPSPSNGGLSCPGDDSEHLVCNTQFCPVDGSWSGWLQWGLCSVTCGGGTRTRVRTCTSPSPSNGGLSCPGDDSEHLVCNTQNCLDASNYFISTTTATWFVAEASCNSMSAHLVIIDNQAEQDFIETIVGGSLGHWIGIRCINLNCAWVDGRNINGGFIRWAPGEPGDRECVWLGYYGNRWDDDYCDVPYRYICEF